MNILYISISGNTRAFAKHLAEYAEKMHAEDPVNPEVTLKEIRYLLTPKIFEILATQEPGAGNEIQLTDALQTLNQTEAVYAREFKGKRYDVGDKLGYISQIFWESADNVR